MQKNQYNINPEIINSLSKSSFSQLLTQLTKNKIILYKKITDASSQKRAILANLKATVDN